MTETVGILTQPQLQIVSQLWGCVKMPSFHSLDADDADNADKL